MKVSFADESKKDMVVGCSDKDTLEVMKDLMNGRKVYRENKIIIPYKSSPKLFRFEKDFEIEWGSGTKEMALSVSQNIQVRKAKISKIKSQYFSDNIKFDYEYHGEYPDIMKHQKIIYNMIAYNDICAILSEPGTCKTGPYLWAIDEYIKRGWVKKALIITLSTLKKNVIAEMEVQTPHLKGVVLSGREKSDKILHKKFKVKKEKNNVDYDIYVASYESMATLIELFDFDYFDLVLLDEAHRIGSPRSNQTKAIVNHFEFTKYKYIVTGTLNANDCLSFYMPFRFLGPDTVPSATWHDFRRQNFYQINNSQFLWKEKSGTKSLVRNIIGGLSVFFSKDECLDLPGVIYNKMSCKMSPDQSKYYKSMKEDLLVEFENMCEMCESRYTCDGEMCDNEQAAANALVSLGKLQQIACGFYINRTYEVVNGKEVERKNIIKFKNNPKMDLLMDYLTNIPDGKKVIIWSQFVPMIDIIKETIQKSSLKGELLTVYQNDDAFEQVELFKQEKYRFLIANPTKGGVGLNIQFSCYQAFVSNGYSYVKRDQAIGRQDRKGQTEKVTVTDFICEDTIDDGILQRLKKKESLDKSLVSLAKLVRGK